MTTRNTPWPDGTPCWVDLAVDDFAKAQRFYGELFGWTVPEGDPEFGGYTSCVKDGRLVAGLSPKMSPEQPSFWTTYLAVSDAAGTLERATQQGGHTLAEPMQISDMGTMAVTVDPAGAVVGFWQSGTHTGFQLVGEAGSVTWNETMSRDWERSREFYRAIFDFGFFDMSGDGFDYGTFLVDGESVAGVGQISAEWPSDVPSHWSTYFKVADMAATVARLGELGGTVVKEPWETPFGTMAAVVDDQGVPFMLMADNEQSRALAAQQQ